MRNDWLDITCGLLERAQAGRDAAALLAGRLPASAAVVQLPMWLWRVARIDVGRKDRGPGGSRLLLPVRTVWDGPHVLSVVESDQSIEGTFSGLGHSGTLEVQVSRDPRLLHAVWDEETTLRVPVMSRSRMREELGRIKRDGELAHWQLRERLEPMAADALLRADRVLAAEVSSGTRSRMVDDLTIQSLTDRMVLGADPEFDTQTPTGRKAPTKVDRTCVVERLIERCLEPTRVWGVDPLRYISRDLHRSALQTLQDHVGDPRTGRSLRDMVRDLGLSDVGEIVTQYNQRHPERRVSRATVIAALHSRTIPDLTAMRPVSEHALGDGAFSVLGDEASA